MKKTFKFKNIKPNYTLAVFVLFLFSLTVISSCKKVTFNEMETLPITPYDPINSAKKTAIISYLTNIGNSDSLIVGQYIGSSDPGSINFDPTLFTGLSKKPGVLASDMGWWTNFSEFKSDFMPTLVNEGKNGSLITLCMYMPNPFNRIQTGTKVGNYEDLYIAGTKANYRLNILLNNAGNVLQQLKDQNIIVLLRPYLEMNGGWFWWGSNKNFPSPEQYKALWVYTYNYFETIRQLDNLLWVYGPNYQYDSSVKSTLYYYPGTNYVDIVGLSYYNDAMTDINLNNSMSNLETLNKPICMSEIGSHVGGAANNKFDVDNLRYLGLNQYKISYFVVWSSWNRHYMAIRDSKNESQLMNHGLIISQDEITY